jgi:acylglycerol lipase
MRHETRSLTSPDGLKLFSQSWLPEKPKAVAVVVPGYAEHVGRYEEVARFLAARRFAAYALDYRGHGRSEGERANVKRFEDFVADLGALLEEVRQRHPELKRFLVGHSMGGMVALYYVLEHPKRIAGLVTSGAVLDPGPEISLLVKTVGKGLSRLLPGLPMVELDISALSRDEAVVRAYDEDPLVYRGKVKARIGAEMLRVGPHLLSRAHELQLPLLIMHGGEDRLASLSSSQRLYERAGSSDKTLKIYDDTYHEIFNDYGKEAVFTDLASWLEERAV